MSTMKPKSGPLANISYNTNNPVLADSRVFVGNLRTEIVTQEQLHKIFKRFGPITGLSIHKGYGFVQFTNEKNARSAVDGTHGTEVGGQKIDCRIASEGASRNKSKKSLDPRNDKGFNNNHGLSGSGNPYSAYISPASLTPEIVRNHVLTLLHSNPTDQTLEDFECAFQAMFNYSLPYHGMTQLGFNSVQEYMMHEFGNFIRVWLDASNSVFLKLDGPIPQPEKTVAPPLPAATQYPSIAAGAQSWGGTLSVQQPGIDDASTKSTSSVVPTQALAASIGLNTGSANTTSGDHQLASNANNYALTASQQMNESLDKPILSYFEFRKIEFKREIISRVYLAHCENPSNLVVQICGEEFSLSLDELNQQMSALYNEEKRRSIYEVPESFFSIGQCCVAKYESLHYRATILSVTPALRKCTVLYVDYGNEDQVDFDDILALHEDFMILPMQAIQVSLANLAPMGPTLIWVGEAKNEIDDYQDIILDCKLVHVDSRQLFVQLSHEGESLSEKLLKNNIAKKQDINYGASSTISHFPPCSRYQKLDFAIKSSRPESRHMFASPSVEKPYLTASPGSGSHFASISSKFSPNRGSSEGLSAGRTGVALSGGKISPSPKMSTTPSKMTPGGGDTLGSQFVHPNSASSNRGGPQLPPTYLIPSSCFQTNVAVISPAASTVNAAGGGVFSGLNGPTAVSATVGSTLSADLSRMAPTYQQLPPAPTQLPKPCPPSDPKWEGSKISRYSINDPVSGKLFVHVVSSSHYEGIYISLVERMKLTGETAQYLLSNQHCILVHRTFESLYSEMRSLNLLYNSEIILCDLDRTYLALNSISTKVIDNDLLEGLFDIILRASQPIKLAPRVW